MSTEKKYARVGTGVLIQRDDGKILLGLRQGTHGAGEWCMPGGKLEFGEKLFDNGKRETKEETGLDVDIIGVISVADELRYLSEGKHYFNVGMLAKYKGGEPKVAEPDKCKEWQWFSLDDLPEKILEGSELIINSFKAGEVDYNLTK